MKDVIPIISDAHLSKIRNVNKNLKETSPNFKETIIVVINGVQYSMMVIFIKEHMEVKAFISHLRKIWLSHFLGTSNADRERSQLDVISRQLSKSALFDLE